MRILALTSISVLALCGAANADVSISNKPTQNMSCVSGVCTAAAAKAVLNVTDLQNMLASGDATVNTGTVAKDIHIDKPLNWSSTSRLTLEAQQSVVVKRAVRVTGAGAVTVTTNDVGGKHGEFAIVPEHGSVQFWDLSSSLIIDGNSYTLVGDIKTLALDIAANPSGFYALAKPYDASVDGVYANTPVPTRFEGIFEGLGNAISNFTIDVTADGNFAGLFYGLLAGAVIRDLSMVKSSLNGNGCNDVSIGTIAVANQGTLERDFVSGTIDASCISNVGGLTAANCAQISKSATRIQIRTDQLSYVGGVAAWSQGTIEESFSDTEVIDRNSAFGAGGLVALNRGMVSNSYALRKVHASHVPFRTDTGGLVGENDGSYDASVIDSYSAGFVKSKQVCGGLIGANSGAISDSYWDSDTSNCGGAGKGLSDAQLKSGLPDGFDPNIWGQSSNINKGYPYLLANPPK